MFTYPGMRIDALREERSVARNARRNDADAARCVVGLDGDLVEEVEPADLHGLDLSQPEVEENRLLHPLVDGPLVACLLRDPDVPRVEAGDRLLDRLGLDLAGLPQLVDALAKLHHAASSPIGLVRKRSSTSYARTSELIATRSSAWWASAV